MPSLRTFSCTVTTLALALCAPAQAEAAPDEPDRYAPLYLGDKNHVRVELGFAIAGDDDSDYFGLQPTLEGRFALGRQLGLQVVLPFMFVDVSAGNEGRSRFDLGNPSLALEVLFDDNPRAVKLVRTGLAFPVLQVPDVGGIGDLEDAFLQIFNVAMAWGGRGMFELWRYMPETMSIFGELQGVVDYDSLYLDFRAGTALMIRTDDVADDDVEIVVQLLARLGFGREIRPFIGLGAAFIPTEAEGLSGDEDIFQFGVQLGLAAAVGKSRLDLHLQINLDEPMGFSFDDDGVLGIHLSGTFPF